MLEQPAGPPARAVASNFFRSFTASAQRGGRMRIGVALKGEEMIGKKIVKGIGYVVGAVVIIGILANRFLSPWMIYRAPADNEYSAKEVQALDESVSCTTFQDWYIRATSGPCRGFVSPKKIAVGERFRAGDRDFEIRIIVATKVEDDFDQFKGGDWYCEAAETQWDLDHFGKEWRRTWLLIPKCQPVR
jgi:hypothetical protein